MTVNIKAMVQRIKNEIEKRKGKGLQSAVVFLTARIKEALNVPAPRILVHGVTPGRAIYYRVIAPATSGAPMRRVTGAAQRSLFWRKELSGEYVIGMSATTPMGFSYPQYHEVGAGDHPSILPTIAKYREETAKIVGQYIRGEVA